MKQSLRIGIFGSYDDSSHGDLAILEGMIAQLQQAFPEARFTVFASSPMFVAQTLRGRFPSLEVEVHASRPRLAAPSASALRSEAAPAPASKGGLRRRLGALLRRGGVLYDLALLLMRPGFWRRQWRRLRSLDILLIGGGGLLVDLYPRWPVYPLLYVLLARAAGIPVMFYAVGAGPIRTLRGKVLFSLALNLSHGATVRDRVSLTVARRLVFRKAKVRPAADPAFWAPLPAPQAAQDGEDGERPRIGLSTAALFRPGDWPLADDTVYRRYVQRMAELSLRLMRSLNARLTLFSTNCPRDLRAAQDIREAIVARGAAPPALFDHCDLEHLAALYPSLDLVVGTRLHSLVLAAMYGVPFVALAYQEKVAAFCEEMGMAEVAFPVGPLLEPEEAPFARLLDELQPQVTRLWEGNALYRARVRQGAQAQREAGQESVRMVERLLRGE